MLFRILITFNLTSTVNKVPIQPLYYTFNYIVLFNWKYNFIKILVVISGVVVVKSCPFFSDRRTFKEYSSTK